MNTRHWFRMAMGLLIVSILSSITWAAEAEPSLWDKRSEREADWRRQGLSLVPYRTNYFFPITYNTSPHSSSKNQAQNKEAKFQFSYKVLLADELFDPNVHLFFTYTQLAMWQFYDRDRSAPFRDINHEPEVLVSFDTNRSLRDIFLRRTEIGLSHQSNGTSAPDSRSWNRVYANFLFDRKNVAFAVKPWIRLGNFGNDDNSDIEEYMGYGEITLSYFKKNHVWSMMFRNNLRLGNNRGAMELNYSFVCTRTLTGLV